MLDSGAYSKEMKPENRGRRGEAAGYFHVDEGAGCTATCADRGVGKSSDGERTECIPLRPPLSLLWLQKQQECRLNERLKQYHCSVAEEYNNRARGRFCSPQNRQNEAVSWEVASAQGA